MNKEIRSMLLLFLTAAIWGFAMAFQREGSRYLQPFSFNACRFLLGAAAMLPLMLGMKTDFDFMGDLFEEEEDCPDDGKED